MDDVRAVMDAVGARRAAFYGLSEGAAMALLFAATYPERTAALVLRSAFLRRMWAPDYPWGRTEEAYDREVDAALEIFGPRERALASVRGLGSFTAEEAESFLRLLRLGSSPGSLEALHRMNREIDVRHVLPAVRVPTLILHGSEDRIVPREVPSYLAAMIPTARLVEVPGAGHLAFGAPALAAVAARGARRQGRRHRRPHRCARRAGGAAGTSPRLEHGEGSRRRLRAALPRARTATLKGVPEEWRLYAVEADE